MSSKRKSKFCASFTPPPIHRQLAAIGLSSNCKRLENLDAYPKTAADPAALCQCFDPSGGEWEDIDMPQPHEWLEAMLEKTPNQSFSDYIMSRPNQPAMGKRTIYLQPLCEPQDLEGPAFPAGPWPSWQALEAAVACFYAPLRVQTLPPKPMSSLSPLPQSRKNDYGTQWNASQVLDALRGKLPSDAYCMLAVTMWDLYPRDEWNFVYGLANLSSRVGVFSFVRHTPDSRSSVEQQAAHMLHRSMKTMLHEIGHMFGMRHCTWFNCLMRGSNGEGVEHQRNHLHLCPVCLRKLHWNLGFDIPRRYQKLLELYSKFGADSNEFRPELEFLQRRLEALQELPAGSTRMPELASWGSRKVRAEGATRGSLPPVVSTASFPKASAAYGRAGSTAPSSRAHDSSGLRAGRAAAIVLHR